MRRKIYLCGIFGVLLLNIIAWISVDFCDWYIKHIFPIMLNTYARLTSQVPFSVGEIMLVLAAAATVFGIGFFIINLICKNKYRRGASYYGRVYAWTALAVCCIMTSNCFIMYHASDFDARYLTQGGADLVADISDDAVALSGERRYTYEDLALLRDHIVERCNTLAVRFERDADGNIIYGGDLDKMSVEAMSKLGEQYDSLDGYYVTPKYLKMSGFFSQQNIMGYYFPFSMEANINSVMYITNFAPTICHELAHTKGFINEDDANFIAFLACAGSDNEFLQYCGYLSVLNYVNNDFYASIGKNRDIYQSHIQISRQVSDDNIFLTREKWQKVEEKAVIKTETVKKVSNTLMDTTLKLNGVEAGIKQYNDVVLLLLKHYDGELY